MGSGESLLLRLLGRRNLGAQEHPCWSDSPPPGGKAGAVGGVPACHREDAPGRGCPQALGRVGPAPPASAQGLCASPRRGGMIQTAEQYQFLHHTLALFAAQLPEEPSP